MALYAQTSGNLSTDSGAFTPIPGLTITLPGGVGVTAVITLNLPNPYAKGSDFPGAMLAISVGGVIQPVQGCFTYNEQMPQSTGRIPATLIVGVPLVQQTQTVEALWYGVRGSTVILDSPASLSANLN